MTVAVTRLRLRQYPRGATMTPGITLPLTFAIASKAGKRYGGFELDQPATLDEAIQNHLKSIAYLKEKFGK